MRSRQEKRPCGFPNPGAAPWGRGEVPRINRIEEKKDELTALYARLDEEKKAAKLWLENRLKKLEEAYPTVFAEKLREVENWEQQELARLAMVYEPAIEVYQYNRAAVRILKRLLREHFRRASTPLKGKRIFCKLDQFDLIHSTLETEDRSKDGGYIRSGIAYRIPEDAKTVRFFAYWNDSVRVDIDLHAEVSQRTVRTCMWAGTRTSGKLALSILETSLIVTRLSIST